MLGRKPGPGDGTVRVKATFAKGETIIAEAEFEVQEPTDFAACASIALTEFKRLQPGIRLIDDDVWVKYDTVQ